jgi:hypothetical protein
MCSLFALLPIFDRFSPAEGSCRLVLSLKDEWSGVLCPHQYGKGVETLLLVKVYLTDLKGMLCPKL